MLDLIPLKDVLFNDTTEVVLKIVTPMVRRQQHDLVT